MSSALQEVSAHPTEPHLSGVLPRISLLAAFLLLTVKDRDTFLMCLVRSQPRFRHGPLDRVSSASARKERCSAFLRGLLLNWRC